MSRAAAGGGDGAQPPRPPLAQPSTAEELLARHLENPFLVLGLPAAATAAEVERTAQRLLAMLAAGLAEASRYATPFGERALSPELVRAAAAELRAPERRLIAEWWARGWSAAGPATGVTP